MCVLARQPALTFAESGISVLLLLLMRRIPRPFAVIPAWLRFLLVVTLRVVVVIRVFDVVPTVVPLGGGNHAAAVAACGGLLLLLQRRRR